MANMEVESKEAEYESDSEEAEFSLPMRRREASDDDDGAKYEEANYRDDTSKTVRKSDGESDGLGRAPEYDDVEHLPEDEEVEEEEGDEELIGKVVDEFQMNENGPIAAPTFGVIYKHNYLGRALEYHDEEHRPEEEDEDEEDIGEEKVDEFLEFEEKVSDAVPVLDTKKKTEPFAAPTSGAFYMHDDRFGDNDRRGRRRQTVRRRKSSQSKDERKWEHDKFEDLSLQQTCNIEFDAFTEEGRATKGHWQVSGNQSRNHDNSNNQSQSAKVVKGRESVKYRPFPRNESVIAPARNEQTGSSHKTESNTSNQSQSTEVVKGRGPVKCRLFTRNKSATAPAINKQTGSTQKTESNTSVLSHSSNKREVQPGSFNRYLSASEVMKEKFSVPQSNTRLLTKAVADSTGQRKSDISVHGSHLTNSTLSLTFSTQFPNQLAPSSNEADRVNRGRNTAHRSESGSFVYGGIQGDKNIGATPNLLPVMAFVGLYPAVLPGYAIQSQIALENPAMTGSPAEVVNEEVQPRKSKPRRYFKK